MAVFTEGTPCWVDASLPDVEAGKRFYGELFGWTFTEGGGDPLPGGGTRGRYADAYSDGRLVATLTPKRDGRMPTVWGVYLATSDAAGLARRIAAGGGHVINDPLRVGRAGTAALVADPGGAVFGLWQAGERTGFEKHGEPGSFCWTEVYTRDKERADAFYEGVLGFQGTDLPGITSADFRMWSPAGTEPGERTAVGGRSVIDDSLPAEMPGHFLVYFCVEDCDAAAATVVRLGGRVRTAPFDIPYGRIAVLADDQGATFGILAEPALPEGPLAHRAPEPTASPAPRLDPELHPEAEWGRAPGPNTEAEWGRAPGPNPEAEWGRAPGPNPEQAREPGAGARPEPGPAAEPDTGREPGGAARPEPDPATGPGAAARPEPEPGPEPGTGARPQAGAGGPVEPGPRPGAGPESEPGPGAGPESEPGGPVEPESRPGAGPESEPGLGPGPESEPGGPAEPEPRPGPGPESEAASRPGRPDASGSGGSARG